MANPVVHFEIIGPDPGLLRDYYGAIFGWEFDTSGRVSDAVSDPDDYGFAALPTIPGGVGGGTAYTAQSIFYIAVDDVETALQQTEEAGGTRVLGPVTSPSGLVIGHFRDPAGNLIGLATPPAPAPNAG